MEKVPVSVVVITKNEEENSVGCLGERLTEPHVPGIFAMFEQAVFIVEGFVDGNQYRFGVSGFGGLGECHGVSSLHIHAFEIMF